MATLLDISGFAIFQRLWPFLLTFCFVYAASGLTAVFKDQKGLRAMVALVMAVLVMLYPIAWKTINLSAPWFVLLIFLAIFLIMAYGTFGVSQDHITKIVTNSEYSRTFAYWTLALVLIITLGSLSSIISEEKRFVSLTEGGIAPADELPLNERPLSERVGFFATITHPKVLGMMLVLLIAFYTISNLAEK